MFRREREVLQRVAEELSTDARVLKVIAYGSRVRGDYRGDSDLDVLVIVDRKDREVRDKVVDTFYSYELESDISFSITILSLKEFDLNERLGSPFIESIKKEGMIIYDSGVRGKEGPLKIPHGEGREAA
jgi:predicted nucleotidyltransferase